MAVMKKAMKAMITESDHYPQKGSFSDIPEKGS